MTGSREFGGAIWTNHALERLGQRGLSQSVAFQAFQYPQRTTKGRDGTFEYQKDFGKSTVTVIAKQNEKKEWLILSCWIDPPLEGYIDQRKTSWQNDYNKASFWRKFWLEIKRQIGL